MKKIIFITADRYPEGNAGATRTLSLALAYKDIEFKPVVIGLGDSTRFKFVEFCGVEYCSLRIGKNSLLSRLFSRMLFPILAMNKIKTIGYSDIDGIVFISGPICFLRTLKRFTTKHNIKLLYDAVEWYSPSEFSNGERNWAYKVNDKINRKIIDSSIRVIAISNYLEDHFVLKGCRVIRVPAILDVLGVFPEIRMNNNGIINIVYAGMPGSKDHLKELIDAVLDLDKYSRSRIMVRIVGINRENYEKKYGAIDKSDDEINISFYGRLSRVETLEIVKKSDFAFLLRPNEERYAKAGFPTKVAESMSLGTAMLCNISSDLDMYLYDGENSIILSDCSEQGCLIALNRILSLSCQQIELLKSNARNTAESSFDFRNYCNDFLYLINE